MHNETLKTPIKQENSNINNQITTPSSSLLLNNLSIDTNRINNISGEIIVTNQVRSINTPTSNGFLSPTKPPNSLISPEELSPNIVNHPLSPFTSTSKHDQVALLISLLTKNNVSIEDLVKMSEEQQKTLLISLVNHANTRGGKTFESCKGILYHNNMHFYHILCSHVVTFILYR